MYESISSLIYFEVWVQAILRLGSWLFRQLIQLAVSYLPVFVFLIYFSVILSIL